jgi:CheY-like chemotaxis protein
MAAADGAEAISLFGPRSLEVRAVVTDVSMPVLDGHTLVKVLRKMSPSLRILGISGLAEQQARFQRETGSHCLLKPFSMEALLGALHEQMALGTSPGQTVTVSA